jgi:lysophospholipase L1-like esterase
VILVALIRHRPLAALLCALLASLALPVAAHSDPGPYVALGDSYTAGPLVLDQVGAPVACARSDNNYPSVVAAATGVKQFSDASCSGATTEHMTGPQPVPFGIHAPQFDALRPDTALVTIGIGGNDVGLVGAAVTCVVRGLLAPTGTACRSSFAKPGGGDRLVDQIAATGPKIAGTLQGIHARSPQARVLVVGYPDVTPKGRSCYPLVPLSTDDVTYVDEMMRHTNAMLAEQAAANDAEYVDTYDESTGHDICTALGTRWFEGLLPTAPAAPIHPNALGEASMARSVLRVLLAPPPTPVLSDLRRTSGAYTAGSAAQLAYRLDRTATVTFTLRRALAGRSVAGRCVPPTKASSGGPSCRRWSRVLNTLRQDGRSGDNALTIGSAVLGRRAGLLRLTATAKAIRGAGQPAGAPQDIYVRVTRTH